MNSNNNRLKAVAGAVLLAASAGSAEASSFAYGTGTGTSSGDLVLTVWDQTNSSAFGVDLQTTVNQVLAGQAQSQYNLSGIATWQAFKAATGAGDAIWYFVTANNNYTGATKGLNGTVGELWSDVNSAAQEQSLLGINGGSTLTATIGSQLQAIYQDWAQGSTSLLTSSDAYVSAAMGGAAGIAYGQLSGFGLNLGTFWDQVGTSAGSSLNLIFGGLTASGYPKTYTKQVGSVNLNVASGTLSYNSGTAGTTAVPIPGALGLAASALAVTAGMVRRRSIATAA